MIAALLLLIAGCASTPRGATSIADARRLAAGTFVIVEGVVTVPAGRFASFTGEQGLAIQDATAGIYVSLATPATVDLGERVRVAGRVGDIAKMPAVASEPSAIARLGRAALVAPEDIATGRIDASVEGRLVRVSGTIAGPVGDDRPYGFKIALDDGSGVTQVFVPVSIGVDPLANPAMRPGARLAAVGYAGRYEDTFEVIPRAAGDLAIAP